MKYTQNHKLKLPEPADTLDIAVLDENFINIDALIAALQSGKADKNSPSLTGIPTAPTASNDTDSTQIATTAFVQALTKSLKTSVDSSLNTLKNSVNSITKNTEPIMVSNTLDVISAKGSSSLDDTVTDRNMSGILYEVMTTWGKATHGKDHGTFELRDGNTVMLSIRLYVENGVIYWDEYYDDYSSDLTYLGEETMYGHRGDSVVSFDYTNETPGVSQEMSLREAVVDLMTRVTLKTS